MDDCKMFVCMFLSIAALLLVTFGSMLIGHNLKNQCVALLKDKPAIEIQAVCK